MKKSLAFLTGICLALSSGLASAVTLNGWALTNPVALDASGLVNGSKNVADLAKKSHALIAPVAKDVSKVLVRGAGGLALSVAVEELLGAVDWVMDPANNQIKYKIPSIDPLDPTNQYYYVSVYDPETRSPSLQGAIDKAAAHYCKINNYTECTGKVISQTAVDSWNVEFCRSGPVKGCLNNNAVRLANPTYDPTVEKEKTLPLDTVSQKIISNAQSGNTDAQAVTVAAAQDILNEAENDAEKAKPIVQQLEANAIVAGIAPHPNKISHDREDEIRNIKPNDPCDEISQAIKDLEETVTWRKSDLNPNEKGTKKYVGHQKRIKILNDKKDDLKRAYTVWCEGN